MTSARRGTFPGDLWAVRVDDGALRPLTRLEGRVGFIGWNNVSVDDCYLYFTWREDCGDLWVMDIVEKDQQ